MGKAFTEVHRRAKELEVKVERLKVKASKAEEADITEFKKLDTYMFNLTKIVAIFLVKEKINT